MASLIFCQMQPNKALAWALSTAKRNKMHWSHKDKHKNVGFGKQLKKKNII